MYGYGKHKMSKGKVFKETPKAFEKYDVTKDLMNVPVSTMRTPATGIDIDIVGRGTMEGRKLRRGAGKKPLRKLRL